MPPDFAPPLTARRGRIVWSGNVTVIKPGSSQQIALEQGYIPSGDPETDHGRDEALKAQVWAAMEAARLGRDDLIPAIMRKDRHDPKRRPVKAPEKLSTQPTED